MTDKLVVLVTCGSAAEAQRIARALVESRLAACVNVLGAPVRSTYRWKDKVESAREHLLVIKTSRRKFGVLRRAVERLHSYDVPEVIAVPVAAGAPAYLKWLAEGLKPNSEIRTQKTEKEKREKGREKRGRSERT